MADEKKVDLKTVDPAVSDAGMALWPKWVYPEDGKGAGKVANNPEHEKQIKSEFDKKAAENNKQQGQAPWPNNK